MYVPYCAKSSYTSISFWNMIVACNESVVGFFTCVTMRILNCSQAETRKCPHKFPCTQFSALYMWVTSNSKFGFECQDFFIVLYIKFKVLAAWHLKLWIIKHPKINYSNGTRHFTLIGGPALRNLPFRFHRLTISHWKYKGNNNCWQINGMSWNVHT